VLDDMYTLADDQLITKTGRRIVWCAVGWEGINSGKFRLVIDWNEH
jgi:hypothetical protein